jgi:hypothetical protein
MGLFPQQIPPRVGHGRTRELSVRASSAVQPRCGAAARSWLEGKGVVGGERESDARVPLVRDREGEGKGVV